MSKYSQYSVMMQIVSFVLALFGAMVANRVEPVLGTLLVFVSVFQLASLILSMFAHVEHYFK